STPPWPGRAAPASASSAPTTCSAGRTARESDSPLSPLAAEVDPEGRPVARAVREPPPGQGGAAPPRGRRGPRAGPRGPRPAAGGRGGGHRMAGSVRCVPRLTSFGLSLFRTLLRAVGLIPPRAGRNAVVRQARVRDPVAEG